MGWEEIIDFLEANPEEYFSAQTISIRTGIRITKVYNYLRRIKKTDYIKTWVHPIEFKKGPHLQTLYAFKQQIVKMEVT